MESGQSIRGDCATVTNHQEGKCIKAEVSPEMFNYLFFFLISLTRMHLHQCRMTGHNIQSF